MLLPRAFLPVIPVQVSTTLKVGGLRSFTTVCHCRLRRQRSSSSIVCSLSVEMLAQRATQQTLRRFAASNPSIASQMAFKKFVAPMAVTSSMQTRPVATQKITPKDSYEILVAQRKLRPTAPHLAIYKWQITSVMSIMNRFTGALLSGGFYAFGLTYLASPLFGWHLDSATLAAAFASWPVVLKVAAKFAVALPFTFHSFNGVRHLVWDFGKQFKNAQVIKTGLFVTGISFASALGLALFL